LVDRVSVAEGRLPQFIDSHAHLADSAFDHDRDEVIARARGAGCVGIVCIGATIADAARAEAAARANPEFVAFTVGVHPHEAAAFDAERDPDAIRQAVRRGAVAIGECGLDYHYDHAPRDVQRRVLSAHVRLAAETNRPLVIHSREAEPDTIAAIDEAATAGVRGVLHCFAGGPTLAERALESGWYVSFSGIVTFRKWDQDALVRMIPDDRLLVESDAPYLAPVPFRGKRNEPAHVSRVVTRIAEARGVDPATIGALVTANATQCFRLVRNQPRP
jgi:TatD DNase family protein